MFLSASGITGHRAEDLSDNFNLIMQHQASALPCAILSTVILHSPQMVMLHDPAACYTVHKGDVTGSECL